MGVRLTNDELRRFYDAHYGRVLGVVTLVTGTRAAAEDVVHEAVARAWSEGTASSTSSATRLSDHDP